MDRGVMDTGGGGVIARLGNPTQIGILVHDARKAAEKLTWLTGMGPWKFENWPPENRPEFQSLSGGKLTRWRAVLAFAYCDNIEVELIETYEGECGYTEYLREWGEGLHHLQFRVDDVDAVAAEFVEQGIEIKMGATGRRPGTKWVLLDTIGLLGFAIELTSK